MELFTFDSDQLCSECNKGCFSEGKCIVLQCMHYIHVNCIKKLISKKWPEYIDFLTIDKNKIYTLMKKERNEYHTMILGNGDDGIIECPSCNEEYTIFSPIYRELGYPKKIMQKVFSCKICTLVFATNFLLIGTGSFSS